LVSVKADFTLVELDECGEGRNGDVQQILHSINGCKSVPNVIAAGTFIGGSSEIEALHRKGDLIPILEAAGCTFAGRPKK